VRHVAALFFIPLYFGVSLHGESKVMASRFPFVLSGSRALPNNSALLVVAALFLIIFVSAIGCIREEDITLEQRAHQLAAQLMCPVCDGQTIDGSSAQISQDMRLKVRELLDEGQTNAEIKDYFVLRYGEDILAAPEGSGFNLLAWVVPVFIVFGGIGIALVAIKNMRKAGIQAKSSPLPAQKNGDLSDFLAQVDRDLSGPPDSLTSDQDPKSPSPANQNEEANF
jgi:cytochrome c-type biogenesis protein CcmH